MTYFVLLFSKKPDSQPTDRMKLLRYQLSHFNIIPSIADRWLRYMWDVDGWAGINPEDYPVVWPRFDGSYTNPDLLKASTAKLPLGDLNWFPDAKAKWEGDKDAIMDHILSLNEDQYTSTGIDKVILEESFRIYPNPVKDHLFIESKNVLSNVKIYNISGQLLKAKVVNGKTVKLNLSTFDKGIYLVEAGYAKGGTYTYKLIKE